MTDEHLNEQIREIVRERRKLTFSLARNEQYSNELKKLAQMEYTSVKFVELMKKQYEKSMTMLKMSRCADYFDDESEENSPTVSRCSSRSPPHARSAKKKLKPAERREQFRRVSFCNKIFYDTKAQEDMKRECIRDLKRNRIVHHRHR